MHSALRERWKNNLETLFGDSEGERAGNRILYARFVNDKARGTAVKFGALGGQMIANS